jgi:CHAT domain-containing protein/Tfp pilus assembly protein PilF
MNFYLRYLNAFTASILLLLSFPLEMTGNTWGSSAVVAQTTGDRKERRIEALRLNELGLQQLSQGQFREALKTFEQALAIVREINERQGEGTILNNIGGAYGNLGQYDKALKNYQQALVIAKEIGDKSKAATRVSNIGAIYRRQGLYAKALENYQQALAIHQKNGDKTGEGTTLNNIGVVYSKQGQYVKALENHQQALDIYQKNSDKAGEGTTLNNIGVVYRRQGLYAKALENYQQALAICQKNSDKAGEGTTLSNIGVVYSSQGKYVQALKNYQQALAIHQKIDDKEQENTTLNNIGAVYRNLGQYANALKNYQQALDISKEIGDKTGECTALNNIGVAYYKLGKYANALNNYQQSLAINKEIGDKAMEATTLNNIGEVYSNQEQYIKAWENYQQALAITRQIGNNAGEGTILSNIGEVYNIQGKYSQAETNLFASIKLLESLREEGLKDDQKISIFEQQVTTYHFLQKALVAQNKTDQALEISERGRGRALVDLLASKLPKVIQNEQSLKPSIQQIKQIAQQQRATIVQYSIIANTFQSQGKQKLDSSLLYVWVVKPTGEITFKQVDLKSFNTSLQDLVINSRDSIGVVSRDMFDIKVINTQPEDPTEELKQLHKILIAPIANLLPKDPNEKVIFIPQESLFLVPFPALLDDKGKYLIEKHTILTAPSIQVLDLTRKQKENSLKIETSDINTALVVGNPTMPKIKIGDLESNLKSLPGSQKEALQIAKFFNIEALTGSKATKSSIMQKMQQASIIHLATHGLLHDFKGFGVPGAIALAPSGNKNDSIDGLLTAGEILDMKLKADLVVLSACDTGRGTITGDGVIGLSRSLFSAGVPSVIVSLWAVDDDSTAFLMTEFYQNLLNKEKPLNKAQALRQAMLTTMKQKEYSNPLHWAAFTLIGEAD